MNYSSGVLFSDVRIRYSSDRTEPVESIVDPQLLTEFISARASQRLHRKQLENTSNNICEVVHRRFLFLPGSEF